MIFPFQYRGGLIIISVSLIGKNGQRDVSLALDTGSDRTIIIPPYLKAIGYSENDKIRNLTITTGSKNDLAYEIEIQALESLGYSLKKPKIIVKSLPTGLFFLDGLLGLDFFQIIQKKLTIDFVNQTLEIK